MKEIEVVCGALIIDEKVMIAQRNYGSAKGKFEFPGGKVEPGETKEEALIREFQEECKIQIKNIEYLESNIDYQENHEIHLTCFTCTSDVIPTTPLVHSEFIWTSPDHIYDYDFFDADQVLVNQLEKRWPCLIKQMK